MVAAILFVAAAAAFEWALPAGFPAPVVPPDNPMDVAKVALGERLFADTRLSATGTHSCASCHVPEFAFTDGRARAVGATGASHPRNTPTLVNAAYAVSFGWLDSGPRSLEAQIRVALEGHDPVELGFDQVATETLEAMRNDSVLSAAFAAAGQVPSTDHIVNALASYVRTLLSADSPFDRYVYWGEAVLSPQARAGLALFMSDRLGCAGCHRGFNLSGPTASAETPTVEPVFVDNIRVPSLRNVAVTAPYFHDGDLPTLDAVLDVYERVGHGTPVPMSADERVGLLAFLDSLTDRRWRTTETTAP